MKSLFVKLIIVSTSKPNIVFILADDFGYTSLNCYGADKSLLLPIAVVSSPR